MSQFANYKNADLKAMLTQRRLPSSGNKAKLVSRLTAYDVDHPFRFLNLPGEIRTMIYTYVAASEHAPKINEIKSKFDECGLSYTTHISQIENQVSIMHPGLFRTCSQIYRESRLLFYRHHAFKLNVWQEEHQGPVNPPAAWYFSKSCVKRVMNWLDAIGAEARRQIRYLKITVHCDSASRAPSGPAYVRFIDDLYNRFSDASSFVRRLDIDNEYGT